MKLLHLLIGTAVLGALSAAAPMIADARRHRHAGLRDTWWKLIIPLVLLFVTFCLQIAQTVIGERNRVTEENQRLVDAATRRTREDAALQQRQDAERAILDGLRAQLDSARSLHLALEAQGIAAGRRSRTELREVRRTLTAFDSVRVWFVSAELPRGIPSLQPYRDWLRRQRRDSSAPPGLTGAFTPYIQAAGRKIPLPVPETMSIDIVAGQEQRCPGNDAAPVRGGFGDLHLFVEPRAGADEPWIYIPHLDRMTFGHSDPGTGMVRETERISSLADLAGACVYLRISTGVRVDAAGRPFPDDLAVAEVLDQLVPLEVRLVIKARTYPLESWSRTSAPGLFVARIGRSY